jgi:DNA repair protein RadC
MNANKSFNAYQVAEIQLTYKNSLRSSERPKIKCSEDAYNILLKNWNDKTIELREEFKILLLNRANKVLGIVNISAGGVSGTVADPKIIFSSALKANCSSIILVHNHPSGNLKPSQADLKLTNNLVQAGKLLEIPVLDHLIISSESYFSMSDEGIIY